MLFSLKFNASLHSKQQNYNRLVMAVSFAASTRRLSNLLQQQYKRHVFLDCGGFSKMTDDQKHDKVDQRNTEKSTRPEKHQSKHDVQKDHCKPNIGVCIIGGGVTPLYTAVLLKQYQSIKNIHLVDTRDTVPGAMASACHMETCPRIDYYRRKDIKHALKKVRII